jgi:hypothetical protein
VKDAWHESKIQQRVKITLRRGNDDKTLFIYHRDMWMLKALIVRVRIAGGSGVLKKELTKLM